MKTTTIISKANKLGVRISEPQAHLLISVINHPNTRQHFIRQAKPELIKVYKSLTA